MKKEKKIEEVPEKNEEAIAEQEEQKPAEDWEKKYQYLYAEFDNFRKRSEKERGQFFYEGAKGVIISILPVLDNFERAIKTEPESENPFYKGVDLIYKQFLTVLTNMGIEEIESGAFNTDLHDAVMHIEDENYGENEIVEVLQKGYKYKDKVIRHSIVKVAN